MIDFTSAQLYSLISAYFWPLVRILGLFTSAPFFSNRSIPGEVRVGLGVAITLLIAPTLKPFPNQELLSWIGLLILIQQFVIGISIGFAIRIIFTGIELAGELISMTMGLGFALFFDPRSQGRSSSISQFMAIFAMLFFIATDLHLLIIECVVESFTTLPIGVMAMGINNFYELSNLGGHIFAIGLQISLPLITALLATNIALAVLTRAAPQLNIFGIGFPVTLLVGFLMLALVMPYWSLPLLDVLQQSISIIRQLI